MKSDTDWYENDQFWSEVAPLIMFGEETWNRAPIEMDLVAMLLKPNGVVLDLCCGLGRHSLEMARRGFRVTGVDRSESFLFEAKEKADRENLDIEFVKEDMRHFLRTDTFDAALSFATSFGFFKEKADDHKVLMNVFGSLKKEGLIIMDLSGKEIMARKFVERNWYKIEDSIILVKRTVKNNWSWIEEDWMIYKDNIWQKFIMAYRPYSAAEIESLLKSCGFQTVEIYGSLSGRPYNDRAERLVILSRK